MSEAWESKVLQDGCSHDSFVLSGESGNMQSPFHSVQSIHGASDEIEYYFPVVCLFIFNHTIFFFCQKANRGAPNEWYWEPSSCILLAAISLFFAKFHGETKLAV